MKWTVVVTTDAPNLVAGSAIFSEKQTVAEAIAGMREALTHAE